jgi:hypothetical protein
VRTTNTCMSVGYAERDKYVYRNHNSVNDTGSCGDTPGTMSGRCDDKGHLVSIKHTAHYHG